jgi:hypothetical protein
MPDNRIQVRIAQDLSDWLTHRAQRTANPETPDLRARAELQLWRGHLAAELARQRWTLGEIGLIADVHNGVLLDDSIGGISMFAAAVIEETQAAPGSYGDKHGVDEDALTRKLLHLGPTATHALADAVATWWEQEREHTPADWAEVGVRLSKT